MRWSIEVGGEREKEALGGYLKMLWSIEIKGGKGCGLEVWIWGRVCWGVRERLITSLRERNHARMGDTIRPLARCVSELLAIWKEGIEEGERKRLHIRDCFVYISQRKQRIIRVIMTKSY